MAIYSLAQRTTVTTITAASWAALSPATNEAAVMEWGYLYGGGDVRKTTVDGVACSVLSTTLEKLGTLK